MKHILVTGSAGFVGYKTSAMLAELGYNVIGVDNLNNYYDTRLKEYRVSLLSKYGNFKFYKANIENIEALRIIFEDNKIDAVVNLAARAGVRYSIEDPFVYIKTNITGTLNLLEIMKAFKIEKFVLASTSSLYAGQPMPFKENLPVNTPISPYAASKKGAEVIAYTYHYLYGIDVTVLRYFTVYGPAGRPDMSIFRFIKWIDEGKPVEMFGDGTQKRDFTFVDDIAKGTIKAMETKTGYEIINLGGNKPHSLNYIIKLIENLLGKKASIKYKPFHKADLKATWADISKAMNILSWEPEISIEEGIERTVRWHIENREFVKNIKL